MPTICNTQYACRRRNTSTLRIHATLAIRLQKTQQVLKEEKFKITKKNIDY